MAQTLSNPRWRPPWAACALVLLVAPAAGAAATPASPSYPFEGSWVRADRACSANAPHPRTYTAREVTTASGRCTFRKVTGGGAQWEIAEDCRRPERAGAGTEVIRMLSADVLLLKHQTMRLKIPRGRRWTRCAAAAPVAPAKPAAAPR